jgi:hypothetical protein
VVDSSTTDNITFDTSAKSNGLNVIFTLSVPKVPVNRYVIRSMPAHRSKIKRERRRRNKQIVCINSMHTHTHMLEWF